MRLKPLPKFLLILLGVGAAGGGIRVGLQRGWIPRPTPAPSSVPQRAELPVPPPAVGRAVAPSVVPPVVSLPMGRVASPAVSGGELDGTAPPEMRMEMWAWNAQAGLIYANGGATTAPGSLMERRGVRLKLMRQDDVPQMQNDLMAFAMALARGGDEGQGVQFVVIMGDGAATFLAGLNPQLERLGADYRAQIVGSLGYSVGEDKLMGPAVWKHDPQRARGGVVAGVLRDGDWNIALKWLGDNGIPNNPDETTYDPTALNWVAADTYVDAAQKYVSGYCETRPVKGTATPRRVCVEGVVTWTPGDVTVARGRGGLVSIVSTREYRWQMPAVVIGITRWMQEHRPAVEGLLAGAFDGAERLKADPAALRRAAELSAAVYHEESADYWLRYFLGVREQDKQGLEVDLGGSAVNGLGENAALFGLDEGGTDLMTAVYRVFGDIVVAQYPRLVASYPPPETVIDPSYVRALLQKAGTAHLMQRQAPVFQATPITVAVSRRAWSIQFETGKATFRPDAEQTLHALFDQLTVAGGLAIEIHGHTDNTGGRVGNQALSERRAVAVRDWLRAQSSTAFPTARVRVFSHGQDMPVASNDTETGRGQNRRVEVVMGVTS